MSLDKFLDPKFFITENFKVILKNLIPSIELRWCGV